MVSVDRDVEWTKSKGRVYKANWDTVFCAASKKMGIRIVVRDVAGELVTASSKPKKHVATPEIAEILALNKLGILWTTSGGDKTINTNRESWAVAYTPREKN